jgi:ketosteroid isomerase-like protein
MSRRIAIVLMCGLLVTAFVTTQDGLPPALVAMAETERAFAKTATVKGWRDAFLDFFADDAIAFAPQVTSAKERLRKQPSTPFSELELVWEPRAGDVAASGELGWLTGPSTSMSHKDPAAKPGHGCYLSIWRKQPDGSWRVYIDVGVNAPQAATFPPGLTRTTTTTHYGGKDGKEAATRTLAAADRDLNAQLIAQPPARAFAPRLTDASRFHRGGSIPIVGRDRIVAWLEQNAQPTSAKETAAEAAVSGDLGYTYGTLDVAEPKPSTGAYVRLWSRDASGAWWLMADVAQIPRAQ